MNRMEYFKAQVTIGMVEMALLRPDCPHEDELEEVWVELLLSSLQYTDTTLEEVIELMDYFKRMQECLNSPAPLDGVIQRPDADPA